MNGTVSERRANIEAAFRRLTIKKDAEQLLPSMVTLLDGMVPCLDRNPAFEASSKAATIKELAVLERNARALADTLESLRGTAIDALADSGFIRQPAIQHQLRQLAESASRAQELNIPDCETRGRKAERFPSAVASILSVNFQSLTGSRPTVRTRSGTADEGSVYGPFPELVRDVFKAMGISANAEWFAKSAAAKIADAPTEEMGKLGG